MNRFLILCFLLFSLPWASGQNCGLEQNIPIRTNATDTVELEVFDLINNDLSDPAQGVCSVYLDFIHSVVGDFEVWLESPGGQQVQLIGPNATVPVGGLAFEYLVTFLAERLNIPPSNQQWDNNLPNPVSASVTEGEFFPFQGRLDDFNTGPVNGTWLLIMTTNTSSITLDGVLRGVKITFCDPLGENCCFAQAGQFSVDSTLQVCSGTPVPDTLPVLDFGGSQPDTREYGYTWLLTRDSLVVDRDSLAAWQGLPTGTYQMYGLSYARADSALLPAADSLLRIDTLRNRLGLPNPPFCGSLTANHWTIEVVPGSDTTFLREVLCAGDSLRLADSTLTATGRYTFALQNQAGCDSTVVLDLEVLPLFNRVIDSTICAGESVAIGSSLYTTTGTYLDTLSSQAGCDSIITLNLAVAEPSRDTIRQLVCGGQKISVGGQDFDSTGVYEVVLTNTAGCDSILVVDLTVLRPQAVVAPGERTLTCSRDSLILDGSNALPAPGAPTYRWERQREGMLAVDIVGTDSVLTVDRPGRYFLQVQLQQDSVVCSQRTTEILVTADTLPPPVEAGSEQIIDCNQPTARLGSALLMADSTTSITWSYSTGSFSGDASAARPVVDRPGWYQVAVTNLANNCVGVDSVRVRTDTVAPQFGLQANGPLSCSRAVVSISTTTGSDQGSPFSYAWSGPCVRTPGDTNTIQVECPGDYVLTMTNIINGCQSADSLFITEDTNSPVAAVADDTVGLDCTSGEAVLDASASRNGDIAWWQNGTQLATGPQLVVTDTGTYRVIVTNTTLNCADTLAVLVMADCTPTAVIQAPPSLTCARPRATLDGSASADGNPLSYQWTGPNTACLSATSDQQVEVRCAGTYQLVVTNTATGQSDTAAVTLGDQTTLPVAEAGNDQTLTCANPEAVLTTNSSSTGPEITYTWINDRGDTVGVTPAVTVMEAGSYVLQVLNEATGCRSEDVVQVNRDADVPDIRFGSPLLPCDRDTFRFSALVVPQGQDYVYQWAGPGIIGNTDSAFVLVNAPGTYRLEVVDTLTGCRVVESAGIEEQTCGPCLEPLTADTITCRRPEVTLEAVLCQACSACTYTWTTVDGALASDPDQPAVQVTEAGRYTVAVTDENGDVARGSVEVVADDRLPLISLDTLRQLTCGETTLTLGENLPQPADSLRYTWENTRGDTLPTSEGRKVAISVPGQYTITATYQANGCSAVQTVAVILDDDPPVAEAGADAALDCGNPVVRLSGQGSSEGEAFAYQWTSEDGVVRSGAETLNPLVEGPGWYVLAVRDTFNACTATDSMRLIPPSDFPMLGQVADPVIGCGQNEVRVVAPISTDSALQYQWIDMAGTLLSDSAAVVLTSPADYRLVVENTNNNCTDQVAFSVTMDTVSPQLNLPGRTELGCTDLSFELASGLPADGPWAFSWTSASGTVTGGVDDSSISVSAADSIFLAVRDTTNSCVAVDTSVVTATNDRPQIQLPAAYALTCSAAELLLDATVTGNPNNYTFSWSTTQGQITSDTDALVVNVSAPGVYRVLATDTITGCQAEARTTVSSDQDIPRLLVDTTGAIPLTCRRTSAVLDAGRSRTAAGALPNFTWEVLGGTAPGGDLSARELTIREPVRLQLIAVDPTNGCQDSTIINVTADRTAPPEPLLNTPDTLTCERASVQLTVNNWDDSFLAAWLRNGDTLTTNRASVRIQQPGEYQFVVIDMDNGCQVEAGVRVFQTTARPELAVISEGELGCAGGTVVLRVEDARSGELTGISWTGPDGGVVGGSSDREVDVVLAGTYTVTAAYAASNCRDTTSFHVMPQATGIDSVAINMDVTGCGTEARGTIRIEEIFGGQEPYLYAFTANGAFTNTAQAADLPPGVYQVRIEDANGCTWTQAVRLESGTELTIDLGPDRDIISGDSIELIPSLTGNFEQFVWRVQDQVAGTTERLTVAPPFTVTYRLLGIAANGCRTEDQVTVFVREKLPVYMPTVFAPESEQETNRLFFVQAGEQVVEVEHFEIFDRWGEMVFAREGFAPNDPAYGWNGRFRGTELNAGVYVYQVIVRLRNGERRMVKGDITLLR